MYFQVLQIQWTFFLLCDKWKNFWVSLHYSCQGFQNLIRWNYKTTDWLMFWIPSSLECWGEEIIFQTPIRPIQTTCRALNLWFSPCNPHTVILSCLCSIQKAWNPKMFASTWQLQDVIRSGNLLYELPTRNSTLIPRSTRNMNSTRVGAKY